MLTIIQIKNLEIKYFNAINGILSLNIGKIITQINSQKLYSQPTSIDKANSIEHAIESIVEQLIAEKLNWLVASLPASADSCYEVGDAVIYVDAKTVSISDGDHTGNKVNVQENQTTYDSKKTIYISKAKNDPWQPNLKHYETHAYYGSVPNLTYIVKLSYSNKNLVEELKLLSLPHGIFYDEFQNKILGAGKTLKKPNAQGLRERDNIRFLFNKITKVKGHEWREAIIYKRDTPRF